MRVLGIDTPERGEPGYREATMFARDWLASEPFQLVACQRDKYGRLLGSVTRNGESFGDQLKSAMGDQLMSPMEAQPRDIEK